MRRLAALLMLLAIAAPATAGTVYKCSSARTSCAPNWPTAERHPLRSRN